MMIPDGSRPIASGRTAEVYAWEEGVVLKLYYPQFPQEWVDYEARVTTSAHAAGAPAPRVLGTTHALNRYGILFESIDGPTMLSIITRAPWKIGRMGRLLADLHAGMHRLSASGLPDQFESLASSIRSAQDLSQSQQQTILTALAGRTAGNALCHMDFHPGNVIFTSGGPRILDWMTVNTGNPWADVARTLLMFTIGEPPQGSPLRAFTRLVRLWLRTSYLGRYLQLQPDRDGELQVWMPILAAARLNEAIPNEKEPLLRIVKQVN